MPDTKEDPKPDVGAAVKATQNGDLPIGTVDEILNSPSDVVEETVEVPEWKREDGTPIYVRLRSFTAHQSAMIRKKMYVTSPDGSVETDWVGFDLARFEEAVVEPKFTRDQALALHLKSGPGFQRIINWVVKKSGVSQEDVREAEEAFQE